MRRGAALLLLLALAAPRAAQAACAPASATLEMVGDEWSEAYVNGTLVGSYSGGKSWQTLLTYNVPVGLLNAAPADNVLGIYVTDRSAGVSGGTWRLTITYSGGCPNQYVMSTGFCTRSTWAGNSVSGPFNPPPGWYMPSYDDSGWPGVYADTACSGACSVCCSAWTTNITNPLTGLDLPWLWGINSFLAPVAGEAYLFRQHFILNSASCPIPAAPSPTPLPTGTPPTYTPSPTPLPTAVASCFEVIYGDATYANAVEWDARQYKGWTTPAEWDTLNGSGGSSNATNGAVVVSLDNLGGFLATPTKIWLEVTWNSSASTGVLDVDFAITPPIGSPMTGLIPPSGVLGSAFHKGFGFAKNLPPGTWETEAIDLTPYKASWSLADVNGLSIFLHASTNDASVDRVAVHVEYPAAACSVPSPTRTVTRTYTPTFTATRTASPSPSSTDTPTLTATPTRSPTPSVTATLTFSATPSPSPTLTATPTRSATPTASPSSTHTVTYTVTDTRTETPSVTPSASLTLSGTQTPTRSATPTRTGTPSVTPSRTATLTSSASATLTESPSATQTYSVTGTRTHTPSPTDTRTPSPTYTVPDTPSFTPTRSDSPTETLTRTATPTLSSTATRSSTPTASPSATESATLTASPSATPSFSASVTHTVSPTATPSATPSSTPSISSTATPSATASATPSLSPTATPSSTASSTLSFSPTATPSLTATLTVTETAVILSPTVTPSFSPQPPITASVRVFNSAGEEVAVLATNLGFSVKPSGLDTAGGFSPGSGAPGQIEILGTGQTLSWDGANLGGQSASGGTYYVVMEITDAFGRHEAWSAPIAVLPADPGARIEVFNAAGELVWSQDVPAAQASQLRVSEAQFLPGGGAQPLKISYGGGAADFVLWDGRNAAGLAVASGTYTVQVSQGQAGKGSFSAHVAVIQAGESIYGKAVAYPNPAAPGLNQVKFFVAGLQPGGRIWGSVYNLAGEKVGTLSLAAADVLSWEIPGGTAAGVYVARINAAGLSGRQRGESLKFSILR